MQYIYKRPNEHPDEMQSNRISGNIMNHSPKYAVSIFINGEETKSKEQLINNASKASE